jgi:NAD(P)H-nitrite reductase large subunit
MHDDDEVCMCFHVSQRKLRAYLKRECPSVASKMTECLDAGTGCGWCRPFLEQLHRQWQEGEPIGLSVDIPKYAAGRDRHRDK